jgi:hypothetical protein
MEEVKREAPPAISLSELKSPKPASVSSLPDRSASAEDMDKLKNLISLGQSHVGGDKKEKNVKEIPEDVLRKILE